MESNQESNEEKMTEMETENESQNNFKQWLQDNLRIIISVLIVVLIAGGIYSYSKRTQNTTNTSQETAMSSDQTSATEGQTDQSADQTAKDDTQKAADQTGKSQASQEKTPSVATGQETEGSFVETAAKGDSMTTLARAALANYLEKNPDSALTAEHKIYIEDYLRKNVTSRRVYVGTSVEFSKDLIKTAITQSKTLSQKQLNNLHKYAVRVPSLS